MKPVWWLEVGPLMEGNYTGMAHVTAALAECMLADTARETGFFFSRAVVPPAIVADMLQRRNGELIEFYLPRARGEDAPRDLAATNIAIFPNRKTCRRGFDYEAQIIHDLSTLLTPQFHDRGTIDFHANSLMADVHSNDLSICVSQATRDDVLRYLGPIDPGRVIAVPLAASFPGQQPGQRPDRPVEPYIIVLGTIEPRKNITQVLEFLRDQPHILQHLRFVFLGRYGWGESTDALLGRYGLATAFAAGRLVFPGFVAEATKLRLLENARMLIYPSVFEGFGLPVLEALSLGIPCLTTRSSSLPEAGGPVCAYFDPFVQGDFARGFAAALIDSPAQADARRAWAAQFSWAATYRRITDTIAADLAARP